MRKPNTPDHHIIMLPDDENPASTLTDQSIPLDHHRTKLVLPQETHLAGEWSAHFLDKLYSHPQHYRAPENISGCHVIGLFNGDLIIDAVSTKRPGEMHYTFHRATKMLQKVTGISLRGGWKEPPIYLGDTPGNEDFRLGDRQAIDGEMEDVVAEVGKARGGAVVGRQRVRLTFDKNNEPIAIARLAEDDTVEKEVDFTTYRAHNVLALIAAKKNQHIDAPIDDPADDSDATIDLIPTLTPSETNTIEDPDLTDNEDWSATYPQRLRISNGPSKEVLEERARREYHGKLDRVAVREKRRQLRSVEEAAAMAARAVMAAFDEGIVGGGGGGEVMAMGWTGGEDVGEDMGVDVDTDMEGSKGTVDVDHDRTDFFASNRPIYSPIHSPLYPPSWSPIHSPTPPNPKTHSPLRPSSPSPLLPPSINQGNNRPSHSRPPNPHNHNKRIQIRNIEQAAAAAMAARNSLNTIRDNPHRSEGRFIEEAAGMAARVAGEIWERLVDEVGDEDGAVVGDEELESVDGDAE